MKEDEFNEIVEQLFNTCKDVLQRKIQFIRMALIGLATLNGVVN